MIAAVHIAPIVSVPVMLVMASVVIWYWLRMGHGSVPRGRKFIRRLSAGLVLLLMPALLRGMSFVDPAEDGRGYIIAWSVVTILVIIVLFIACIDALMTVRSEQHRALREMLADDRDASSRSTPGEDPS